MTGTNTVSTQTEEPHGEAEAAATTNTAGKKKKKLIIIGAAAAVTLLGGGGGAYMMFGGKPAAAAKGDHKAEAAHEEAAAEEEGAEGEHGAGKEEVPLDVPPILVNLRSPDGAPHFLKLHVMLIPGPKSNFDELKKKLPILMDAYQPFLRELRPEDLSGSASIYRIKEELMRRSVTAIGADQVKEILVQDLIQQ